MSFLNILMFPGDHKFLCFPMSHFHHNLQTGEQNLESHDPNKQEKTLLTTIL